MSSDIDVLVIGHLTADLVPGGTMLGGTVSYAAPTYAAFGHTVGILTSAAYNESLTQHLLPFANLMLLPAATSLTYENVYSDSGRQQYVRATARPISVGHVPIGWSKARYVHLGPLAAEIEPLEMARHFRDATVMLTLQGMMRRWDDDGLVKYQRWFGADTFKLIDIVVYSKEDIQEYPQLTDEIRQVCKHLIVTNGRDGGTYYHAGQALPYDSILVQPRDFTGAGDVFAASVLALLPFVGQDAYQAVKIAGRLAAYSITRSGLDSAPTAEEIRGELERARKE